VPAELAALILRMMAKQPADRPANAAEVGEALRAMVASAGPGGIRSLPVLAPT
jgi:hypothetical protein